LAPGPEMIQSQTVNSKCHISYQLVKRIGTNK
jgi:hypothetical protein